MAGSISPIKYAAGVLLVAVPLFATTYYSRPTFANAIQNHLQQEELEAKRQHNYKTDYYEKDDAKDELLKNYVKKGTGKAREFQPNHQ